MDTDPAVSVDPSPGFNLLLDLFIFTSFVIDVCNVNYINALLKIFKLSSERDLFESFWQEFSLGLFGHCLRL